MGHKAALASQVDIGCQRPLGGGVFPTRVLEAGQGQIAERHIFSVHYQPTAQLRHALGQVLLSRVEIIPLAQQIAHTGIIGRTFEQMIARSRQWLVSASCDLGHLAIGGRRRVEPALQHLQAGQIGDRRERAQQVIRSLKRCNHRAGAPFRLVPHIAAHAKGARHMQVGNRPRNCLGFRQQAQHRVSIGHTAGEVAGVAGHIGPDRGGAALDELALVGWYIGHNPTFRILKAFLGRAQLIRE